MKGKVNMRRIILSVAILLCLARGSSPTEVYAQTRTFSLDSEKSKLEYSFKSTLHPVEGVAREFSGEFIFSDAESPGFKSGEVVVNPARLDSKNKKRDSNMRKMLEVPEFPEINYEIGQLEKIKQLDNGFYEGVFKGTLTIKDVTRDVDVDVIIQELDENYILTGQCEISLAAFDLKPPSVLGIIKVFDPVRINFEVRLK